MPKNDNPQVRRFLASMEKHGQQEAVSQFCEGNPLSKSANGNKKFQWAKSLCAFLENHYDDESVKAIRMDCACGPKYGYGGSKLKAVYEKSRDPYDFVEKANALDLGSCWINQLHWLDENQVIREFLYQYGLRENETITGGLILGYAEGGLPERTPLERKGNPVDWV